MENSTISLLKIAGKTHRANCAVQRPRERRFCRGRQAGGLGRESGGCAEGAGEMGL